MNLEVIKASPDKITQPAPILFIHGMWHAAWCWAENFLPYFSGYGYDCYALNLRGHGNSDGHKNLRWHSVDDYVADLTATVNRLPSPPILIGHSMGGMIVQKYLEAHRAPAAVLLASTPPRGVLAATARTFLRHPACVIKSSLTLSMSPMVSTPQLAQESFFSADIEGARLSKYFSLLQDESFRAYLDMLFLNLPRRKIIDLPLLVLGAGNDMMISPREVQITAQTYGVKHKLFPDMAHDMMLDSHWKDVADHILDWIDEQDLSTAVLDR